MRMAPLALSLFLAGCAGYSVKAIHEPSMLEALDTVDADLKQAEKEMITRYDDLYDQVEEWIPVAVAAAQARGNTEASVTDTLSDFRAHRDEFSRATALITRARTMNGEMRKSLNLQEEPTGNLQGAGAFIAGVGAGAAAVAAF